MIENSAISRWLSFSWPIAFLAISASVAGIFIERPYANETANWQGQAIGQDLVNVAVAYPALLILAVVAKRGRLSFYLAWAGLLAYSVYTFAIYSFAINFGPLFLVYVAVFGLSAYALIGSLVSLDADRVKAEFSERATRRPTAILLIVIGVMFYLLWLSEILPATFSDGIPPSLRDAGLATNPVYVLDMALLLPAAILSGVLLLRSRPLGFVLAPVILAALTPIALGIVAAMVVLRQRGEPAPLGVTLAVVAIAALQLAFLVRFLRGIGRRSSTPVPAREGP